MLSKRRKGKKVYARVDQINISRERERERKRGPNLEAALARASQQRLFIVENGESFPRPSLPSLIACLTREREGEASLNATADNRVSRIRKGRGIVNH